jgi:hypothetical protein
VELWGENKAVLLLGGCRRLRGNSGPSDCTPQWQELAGLAVGGRE